MLASWGDVIPSWSLLRGTCCQAYMVRKGCAIEESPRRKNCDGEMCRNSNDIPSHHRCLGWACPGTYDPRCIGLDSVPYLIRYEDVSHKSGCRASNRRESAMLGEVWRRARCRIYCDDSVKKSRVSVGDEDAADGVRMKAVYSALDGHDPGGVRYGRLFTTGDRKPAPGHATMFAHLAGMRCFRRCLCQDVREAITVPLCALRVSTVNGPPACARIGWRGLVVETQGE